MIEIILLVGLGLLMLSKKPVEPSEKPIEEKKEPSLVSQVLPSLFTEQKENPFLNPALSKMINTMFQKAEEYITQTGIFNPALELVEFNPSLGGMAINTMLSGQSTYSQPYSGYAETLINLSTNIVGSIFSGGFSGGIPILGTVIGGFIEGLFGDDVVEPLDWNWKQKLKMYRYYQAGKRIETFNKEDSDWYVFEYTPAMARIYGYRGMVMAMAVENVPSCIISNEYLGSTIYNPDGSVKDRYRTEGYEVPHETKLYQFHQIQKRRDAWVLKIPADKEIPTPPIPVMDRIETMIFYVDPTVNPFYGMSEKEVLFFYNEVLPEINPCAYGGFFGWELLPIYAMPVQETQKVIGHIFKTIKEGYLTNYYELHPEDLISMALINDALLFSKEKPYFGLEEII